jgi:hypothetical protein
VLDIVRRYYSSKQYYCRRVRLPLGARIGFAPRIKGLNRSSASRKVACHRGQRIERAYSLGERISRGEPELLHELQARFAA